MSRYLATSTFSVAAFTRQREGEEVIIGLPERGTFLALSPDAVELIDWLAEGHGLGEAEARYVARYGQQPESEELLRVLEQRGFLRDRDAGGAPSPVSGEAPRVRYHFAGFPQGVARALSSPGMVALQVLLIALGVGAAVAEPGILPRFSFLVAPQHLTATLLALMALSYGMLFLHEMAHLIAARAVGVSCRLGIGHRLWILVAETDMTGVWAIPRRQRYLPFLAGPLLDLTLAATLLLLLFGAERGGLPLPGAVRWWLRASFLMLAFRVLWQFHFFLRTDLYCVFANLFGCKNLMGDTEAFLRHRLGRLLRRETGPDPLAALPLAERRVIRVYSGFWVLGRTVALGVLLGVQLPLVVGYLRAIGRHLEAPGSTPYMVADALVLGLLAVSTLGVGVALWVRGLLRERSARQPQPAGSPLSAALEQR